MTGVSRRILIGAILAFAVLLIAYSFNPWYPLALLLLTGTGITSQVGATMISTTLQLQAPGRLRGRVMSIYAITIIGLASLGALGSGAVAEVTGPGIAVAGGAILMGLTALLIAPRIDDVDHVSGAPAAGAPTVAGGLPTAENRG